MPVGGKGSDNTDLPVRFVTAASLFDGHDAVITSCDGPPHGARSFTRPTGADDTAAAVGEDVHGMISSHQGGGNSSLIWWNNLPGARHYRAWRWRAITI